MSLGIKAWFYTVCSFKQSKGRAPVGFNWNASGVTHLTSHIENEAIPWVAAWKTGTMGLALMSVAIRRDFKELQSWNLSEECRLHLLACGGLSQPLSKSHRQNDFSFWITRACKVSEAQASAAGLHLLLCMWLWLSHGGVWHGVKKKSSSDNHSFLDWKLLSATSSKPRHGISDRFTTPVQGHGRGYKREELEVCSELHSVSSYFPYPWNILWNISLTQTFC